MTIARREFLKTSAIAGAGLSLMPLFGESLFAAPAVAGAFPFSNPEAQGISSTNILDFINAAEKDNLNMHSIMILRNGKNVAQGWWDPYKPDLNHVLHSLSKSFTSTAIGFAISEGLLSVEDKVTKFFPDDLPATQNPHLDEMQVKHLLTMNTGHEADTAGPMRKGTDVWTKVFLATPIQHQPGTYFLYDTGATYMLSAIISKVTGRKTFDYLTPRLFKPMGIEGAHWEVSPQGINTGGFGLWVKTEDIAKLGTLYLQNGTWNGKQVLPVGWSDTATTYKVPNASLKGQDQNSDWQQGYCYQFWRCRHDFFRGDGANGQYCLVSRKLNTVIAITSEVSDMQKTLNHVWDYLLPGIKDDKLPEDAASQKALKQKLASLSLLPQKTNFGQNTQAKINGKPFQLKGNAGGINKGTLIFNNSTATLQLETAQTSLSPLTGGLSAWAKGQTGPLGTTGIGEQQKYVGAGVWRDENTFVLSLQYYETSSSDQVVCQIENDAISIKFINGVAATTGNPRDSRPVLEGNWV